MGEGITIIGGGLSGLTLGIGLRQRGVPVRVWEAAAYPRHRVCGEFISGLGLGSLTRLGLLEALHESGKARPAVTAAFFAGKTSVKARALPEAALCIPRFDLDDWLAREFTKWGGELVLSTRWSGESGPGIVHASGRRPEPAGAGWRLFGLKAHASDVTLDADLEMHFVPEGYVGLSRQSHGRVNICGLFRTRAPVPELRQRWREWLGGAPNSVLNQRLAVAQIDPASFCSVAALSLRPRRACGRAEFCVGDALTMIPPVTGNGMSMAFESAELAIDPLSRYSQGDLDWSEAGRQYARLCDDRFSARLRWAGWLQPLLLQPVARAGLVFGAVHFPALIQWLFARTR